MPKQKDENKLSDKEQFRRFREKTKELDVERVAEDVEDEFKRMSQSPPGRRDRNES